MFTWSVSNNCRRCWRNMDEAEWGLPAAAADREYWATESSRTIDYGPDANCTL